MQPNLLIQKFELFNVCPFLICVTNRKGELVFMNQFAKNYFSESSIANSIHIYDRIMELFPESYQSIKEIVDLALINNENIEKTVPIINNEELERDPKVAAFVKNVKKSIKENPQFRSYMKQFLNKLDEE